MKPVCVSIIHELLTPRTKIAVSCTLPFLVTSPCRMFSPRLDVFPQCRLHLSYGRTRRCFFLCCAAVCRWTTFQVSSDLSDWESHKLSILPFVGSYQSALEDFSYTRYCKEIFSSSSLCLVLCLVHLLITSRTCWTLTTRGCSIVFPLTFPPTVPLFLSSSFLLVFRISAYGADPADILNSPLINKTLNYLYMEALYVFFLSETPS